MTVQEATYYILNNLRTIRDDSEASQSTDWIMEHITGSKKTERMLYKNEPLSADEEARVKQYTERLLSQEPVQYILNEAWFCGLRFYVDKHVLVPRPETEELVEWVITNCKFPVDALRILDIGTGSGCIAIALKRRIRRAEVWACDTSEQALEIAKKNAGELGTAVNFLQLDFLDKEERASLPLFDIIISNPPYIPVKDKATMKPNVTDYEPATALFVPDNDPLVFYKAIAEFGKMHLAENGSIFTEIHEDLGTASSAVFQAAGYSTEIKKDMQQKDRMIRANYDIKIGD
jgi:release factor glutamine methyltransferase